MSWYEMKKNSELWSCSPRAERNVFDPTRVPTRIIAGWRRSRSANHLCRSQTPVLGSQRALLVLSFFCVTIFGQNILCCAMKNTHVGRKFEAFVNCLTHSLVHPLYFKLSVRLKTTERLVCCICTHVLAFPMRQETHCTGDLLSSSTTRVGIDLSTASVLVKKDIHGRIIVQEDIYPTVFSRSSSHRLGALFTC